MYCQVSDLQVAEPRRRSVSRILCPAYLTRSGDHSSGREITLTLKRPTRKRATQGLRRLRRTTFLNASLFGLAPQGVCLAEHVAMHAGDAFTSPFHHRPRTDPVSVPLPKPPPDRPFGLSLLCCTFPSGHPAWPLASLLSFGVRTFLPWRSTEPIARATTRSTPKQPHSIIPLSGRDVP